MIADVLVIGGGPVGLAAAIAARRKGLSVILADGCEPSIDKACGEGVLPDGLAAAARLGLHLPLSSSFAFRGIRFHGDNVSVAAEFPNGWGRGFRRTTLHRALAVQAEQCGVELRWGCAIGGLQDIPARWIVGADGTASRVRGWAGLEATRRDARRFGFRRHFRLEPWTDYVEIHWGAGCQIYVTPVAPDEVCVAVISRDPKLRVPDALRRFPPLLARLEGAPESSEERGAVTASRQLRRVVAGNVALIGDASGSVDAITGEGLCLGFHQALALADAIGIGRSRTVRIRAPSPGRPAAFHGRSHAEHGPVAESCASARCLPWRRIPNCSAACLQCTSERPVPPISLPAASRSAGECFIN